MQKASGVVAPPSNTNLSIETPAQADEQTLEPSW